MTIALTITHPFVSAIADGGDTSLVQPSNWNATHTAALTLAASRLLGRATGSDGAAEEISLGTGLSFSGGVLTLDADLQTWAGVTPSANGQSLVSAANYAAMRTLLDLEAGTDFYSVSAADAAIAAAARPANVAAQFYIVPRTGYMANLAMAANTIYYMPFWLPRSMTISDLGVRCTTGAAQNIRVAIYANNSSTNRPSGSPLAQIDSALVAASSTSLSGDIRGANVTLTGPAIFWAAVWSDGTPTLNCVTNDSYTDVGEYVGITTLTNWANARHGVQFTSAETFGTDFPDASSETITEAAPAGGRFIIAIKAA